MKYSVIIPVYNRPQEVDELLASLAGQQLQDFEVIVVEDGSAVSCADVVAGYRDRLPVRYLVKENAGPGPARNYGAAQAQGEYLLILDSDVVLPAGYLQAVDDELEHQPADAFGGPDRADESFTPIQKAINYSMTSFFTTGGIRGGRKKMDRFYPRSFNMGVRRELYRRLGGFAPMRFGEDIDLSIRIFKSGARCRLFPGAWVWHKRRTDLKKFFKQVHNSGIARIHLFKKYPESLKPVHVLPAAFTLGVALLAVVALWGGIGWGTAGSAAGRACGRTLLGAALLPLILFSLLVCIDSACRNRSLKIGLLSIVASFVQLTGYGSGFLRAWWQRCVRGRGEFEAFEQTFYQ
ncbi:MAG: glycosyltransferase [Bacteroidaceae bacterium]|nr:glycosyltransferase [Bacteroidaceae bacterium]